MIAIIDIPSDKQSEKDELFVYTDQGIRGTGSPIRLEDGRLMYFVSIYGNQVADTLSLQFKSHNGQMINVYEKLSYSSFNIIGSTSNPKILTLDADGLPNVIETIWYVIYPNPFKDQLQFELSLPEVQEVEIELLNVIGKPVTDKTKLNGTTIKTMINTSGLKSGIYIVKLTIGGNALYEKLIKE
ncbi:MAG: T9SS type A sorting domain-containing protein [Bacteroidales bacterium]|nr:T9SS type A sorting domain-containing protein [Bacteroidales bacterium]